MKPEQSYKNRPTYILADCGVKPIDMKYIGDCLAQKYGNSSNDNAGPTMLGYMLTMKAVEKSVQPEKTDMPTELGSMLIDDLILPLPKKSVA